MRNKDMPYKRIDLDRMKSANWIPNNYFIDYIGLLGNPENLVWTSEEETKVDKLFEEIKALANKMVKDEED